METITENKRKRREEIQFQNDVKDESFDMSYFRLAAAVKRKFENVSFKYCIFDNCYFRNCKFIDCDFTGVQFIESSFRGSTFDGSKFDYARFNSTLITTSLIDRNLPGFENVALEFARSLRVNFSQTGNSNGVNRSIQAELDATKVHLRKAAWSKESYYRKKYQKGTEKTENK